MADPFDCMRNRKQQNNWSSAMSEGPCLLLGPSALNIDMLIRSVLSMS